MVVVVVASAVAVAVAAAAVVVALAVAVLRWWCRRYSWCWCCSCDCDLASVLFRRAPCHVSSLQFAGPNVIRVMGLRPAPLHGLKLRVCGLGSDGSRKPPTSGSLIP